MRISDWSSDVCSSDLQGVERGFVAVAGIVGRPPGRCLAVGGRQKIDEAAHLEQRFEVVLEGEVGDAGLRGVGDGARSEEHTSELQSLMRISYAVFCLKHQNIIT